MTGKLALVKVSKDFSVAAERITAEVIREFGAFHTQVRRLSIYVDPFVNFTAPRPIEFVWPRS